MREPVFYVSSSQWDRAVKMIKEGFVKEHLIMGAGTIEYYWWQYSQHWDAYAHHGQGD